MLLPSNRSLKCTQGRVLILSQKCPFWAGQVDPYRKVRTIVASDPLHCPRMYTLGHSAALYPLCCSCLDRLSCPVKHCTHYQPILTKFGSVPGGHIFLTSTLVAPLSYTLTPVYSYPYTGQIAYTLGRNSAPSRLLVRSSSDNRNSGLSHQHVGSAQCCSFILLVQAKVAQDPQVQVEGQGQEG